MTMEEKKSDQEEDEPVNPENQSDSDDDEDGDDDSLKVLMSDESSEQQLFDEFGLPFLSCAARAFGLLVSERFPPCTVLDFLTGERQMQPQVYKCKLFFTLTLHYSLLCFFLSVVGAI